MSHFPQPRDATADAIRIYELQQQIAALTAERDAAVEAKEVAQRQIEAWKNMVAQWKGNFREVGDELAQYRRRSRWLAWRLRHIIGMRAGLWRARSLEPLWRLVMLDVDVTPGEAVELCKRLGLDPFVRTGSEFRRQQEALAKLP